MKKFIIPGLLLLISGTAISQQLFFESTRNITDAVTAASTKEASISITASSLVNPSNGVVQYQAGSFVELNPGFNTEMNSSGSFTASIGVGNTLARTQAVAPAAGNKKAEMPGGVSDIKVYPNPANDFLFIQLPQHAKALSVEIRDVQGRLMPTTLGQGEQSAVNISKLAPGSYFLKVNAKGQRYTTLFIKQ